MTTSTEPRALPIVPAPRPTLAAAVVRDLHTPIAALRAALEALKLDFASADHARGDARAVTLDGALEQLERLARGARALADWSLPGELRMQSCTLEELARSALRSTRPHERSRALIAVEDAAARIKVDASILSRLLAHLVACGLEDNAQDVLIHVRKSGERAIFSVLVRACGDARVQLELEDGTCSTLGLGLAIARRDVQRMGGMSSVVRQDDGLITYEISFALDRREVSA